MDDIPPASNSNVLPSRRWTAQFLDLVEWAGNKLPDPVMLFLWALILTWMASTLLASVEFKEIDPRTGGKDRLAAAPIPLKGSDGSLSGQLRRENMAVLAIAPDSAFPAQIPWMALALSYQREAPQPIQIKNQLTGPSLTTFLSKMVKNFAEFPPLGLVLVVLLGVGVAEHVGFINAGLKALLSITPPRLLTPMVMLVAILSHAAGDSGYVVVIPLGGVIYLAAGRHPLAGIAVAFAGVSGGLSANFIPIILDPLLQGFTQKAAQIIDPARTVNPLCNWGFTAASSVLIILLGWYITDRVVEPRLRSTPVDGDPNDMPRMDPLTPREWSGLIAGLLTGAGMLLLLVWTSLLPQSSWSSKSGALLVAEAPLMQSIVPLMFLLFLVPGIVYGYVAGTVRSHRDIIQGMSKSMGTMSYYLVLAFVAAQFIYAFGESNVGILIALKGGELLKSMGVLPQLTIVGVVLLSTLFNLLIGSASAKWALLSPIFVPMLMEVGLSPELTQAAYRIGDSCTNIITPLMPYFPLVVVYCQRYVKSTGIGTLVALMLPYALSFLACWTLLLLAYWQLGIPLGLEAKYTYP